jgi:hypothetical protein
MHAPYAALHTAQLDLIAHTRAWALRRMPDPEHACVLRHRAIRHAHDHYRAHIPAYRRLASEEHIGAVDSIQPIAERLMSTDDLFKSYRQQWLDDGDFAKMNGWLSEIHHRRVTVDITNITLIDAWVERLEAAGVRPVYSSGTSGNLSFVPRDAEALARLRTASTNYLLPLLAFDRIGSHAERRLIEAAASALPPEPFERVARAVSPRSYDGVFLDFRVGRTGMQAIGRELAPVFQRRTFLYDADLSASALRSIARGPRTEHDRRQIEQLQAVTVAGRAQNYARVLAAMRASVASGRKVFLFGVPFQLKELCGFALETGQNLALPAGSMALFGGGWKSFAGEQIPRPELMQLITDTLGLPEQRIVEGYAMTEINTMLIRCVAGRFHIPPLVEPLLFDEALMPMPKAEGRGVFGFLDPFASAYPGFIITGDEVRMVDGACACGLSGPAVTEIVRAGRREIKGCGGVMASVRA